MKIIDLLNKIAKGEEVPKQIKYCGTYYYWTGFNYENSEADTVLFWYCIYSEKYINDEIEIIEDTPKISKLYINNKLQYDLAPKEDKKIEKIKTKIGYGHLVYLENESFKDGDIGFTNRENVIVDKINEIIDKLNKEE